MSLTQLREADPGRIYCHCSMTDESRSVNRHPIPVLITGHSPSRAPRGPRLHETCLGKVAVPRTHSMARTCAVTSSPGLAAPGQQELPPHLATPSRARDSLQLGGSHSLANGRHRRPTLLGCECQSHQGLRVLLSCHCPRGKGHTGVLPKAICLRSRPPGISCFLFWFLHLFFFKTFISA